MGFNMTSIFGFGDPIAEIEKITSSFEKMAVLLDAARQKYMTRKSEINTKITELQNESTGLDNAIDKCGTIAENLRKIVKP